MSAPLEWTPDRWKTEEGIERIQGVMAGVAVCCPTYRGTIDQTRKQIGHLVALGAKHLHLPNHPHVDIARNCLTALFLACGRPWSLWIDDDVHAPQGLSTWLEFLTRAIERSPAGDPVVIGGAYPCKRLANGQLAAAFLHPETVTLGEDGGYHLADWVGGGALLLSRALILRIAEELGIPGPGRVLYSTATGECAFGPDLWRHGIHQTNERDPGYPEAFVLKPHGEDVGLFARLHRHGVALEIDTRARFDHQGTHSFTWENTMFGETGRRRSMPLAGVAPPETAGDLPGIWEIDPSVRGIGG